MGSDRPIAIAAFAGSLRKGSYNKSLLRALQEESPDGVTIEIFDLKGVPLYNADDEQRGDPPRVTELREAIAAGDALLIATPEYNHGVPAVTKNAIDWASRPPGKSVLNGKPVGILGASPGMLGTARAQSQLRQSFVFTDSYCMAQPEILVYRAHEKFDETGRLTDDKTRTYLRRYLESLRQWTLRFV